MIAHYEQLGPDRLPVVLFNLSVQEAHSKRYADSASIAVPTTTDSASRIHQHCILCLGFLAIDEVILSGQSGHPRREAPCCSDRQPTHRIPDIGIGCIVINVDKFEVFSVLACSGALLSARALP
jgi:hypothetical protein